MKVEKKRERLQFSLPLLHEGSSVRGAVYADWRLARKLRAVCLLTAVCKHSLTSQCSTRLPEARDLLQVSFTHFTRVSPLTAKSCGVQDPESRIRRITAAPRAGAEALVCLQHRIRQFFTVVKSLTLRRPGGVAPNLYLLNKHAFTA